MDKKTVLALILIAVVIITMPYYQKLIQGDRPAVTEKIVSKDSLKVPVQDTVIKQRSEKKVVSEISAIPVSEKAAAQKKKFFIQDSTERLVRIESEKICVEISNFGGGSFKKFVLKKYSKHDSTLVNMIDNKINNNLHLAFMEISGSYVETDTNLFFQSATRKSVFLKENNSFKIEYRLPYKDSEIKKTFVFYGDYYHVDIIVQFKNPENLLLNRQYQIGWKNGLPSTESYASDDNNYNQAYVYMGDELESYDVSDEGKKETITFSGNADWIGIRTKYFLGSLININGNVSDGVYLSGEGIKKDDYIQRIYNVGYNARFLNDQEGDSLRLYMGPLYGKELAKYDKNLDVLIMNNGWYEKMFRFLTVPVLPLLEFLYSVIPNYGIVIIIFSILIKILVFPLTKKSFVSMREMQKVQPLLSELKEKYKGDPQRLNKETMKLYKEHGVNPLGGCLPTLLQFPFLISLFIVFRSTIQLRGAVFIPGWINDLSMPDTLFTLPISLPLYGDQFNLLPILMALTMIIQSKMTMQDPKQKAMVYMMPVFMLLLFNTFPSGLNLYYTLFNIWSIIQQKYINRGLAQEVVPVKKKTKKHKK